VIGCQANNESLPFPDSSFDAYISNLSVMIVSNHRNQLREAYRVMQPGASACFSVWGRKENSLFFTLVEDVIKEYLSADQVAKMEAERTNFHLYEDGGA